LHDNVDLQLSGTPLDDLRLPPGNYGQLDAGLPQQIQAKAVVHRKCLHDLTLIADIDSTIGQCAIDIHRDQLDPLRPNDSIGMDDWQSGHREGRRSSNFGT
jgi:hypothetical protein